MMYFLKENLPERNVNATKQCNFWEMRNESLFTKTHLLSILEAVKDKGTMKLLP